MNSFGKRYTVYLLIFTGGYITHFDWWIQWVGVVLALSGYWLLIRWGESDEA